MTDGLLLGIASAFWLGLLTSISPCPLATNIAAVSFIGRSLTSPWRVVLSGLLYTIGRALTYVIIGSLLIQGLLSAPWVSHFLQKYMNKLLGPVLILVGLVLLNVVRLNLPGLSMSQRMQDRIAASGIVGAAPLGMLLALSFCPVAAALFFGSLIPLSVKFESGLLLPLLYGIGTGLPVFVCAVLIAQGVRWIGTLFEKVGRVEWWARNVTALIFVAVGIYYILVNNFGLIL